MEGTIPKVCAKLFAAYEPGVNFILTMYLMGFINQHVDTDQICFGDCSLDVSAEMELVHKAAERCR